MSKTSLLKLYFIFLKIGAILLGGGYVILPILKAELCEKRKLLNESELIDYFALSQSLPGIVAANISMFTGYKIKGKMGAIAALMGIITVPFISIIILASVLNLVVDNKYIVGMFWGVGIAVIALIILTAFEVWQKTERDLFFNIIFLSALITLVIFELSPVDVIIIFSVIGVLTKSIFRRRGVK